VFQWFFSRLRAAYNPLVDVAVLLHAELLLDSIEAYSLQLVSREGNMSDLGTGCRTLINIVLLLATDTLLLLLRLLLLLAAANLAGKVLELIHCSEKVKNSLLGLENMRCD